MFSPTITALEKFDNPHDFERMCADVLIHLGYRDVVLIAPRGGNDGGMDVTFTTETGGKGLACVTLRKDIEKKFNEDFTQRKAGEFEKYYFFCTSYLTAKQKLRFAKYCLDSLRAEFVPQDIEALRGLLDNALISIRERCLGIEDKCTPQLRLGFYENEQFVSKITCQIDASWHWQTSDTYVQEGLRKKQAELDYILARADASVPENEIQKVKDAYEKYFIELKFSLQMQFIKNHTPKCRLVLTLKNDGTAPAQDIRVRLTFPNGSSTIYFPYEDEDVEIVDDLPDKPATPEWAQSPISQWYKNMMPSRETLKYLTSSSYNFAPSYLPSLHHRIAYNYGIPQCQDTKCL